MRATPPTAVLLLALMSFWPAAAEPAVTVVTTLENYAALAREVGKDRVTVSSIAPPREDAHFIRPKPSYALMLRRSDLFVTTGLDLELWAPVLVNKSGNRRILDGGIGFVSASHGIALLDKPSSLSRLAGDIHIYGNPHIFTSPVKAKSIATNIATGLCKVDPEGCDTYTKNLESLQDRLSRRLYGEELVDLIGSGTLDRLALQGELVPFLQEQGIVDDLGGWLGRGRTFRGRKIICYHKNWIYFTNLFGLEIRDYVEPKPGIPPAARHVARLIAQIDAERIPVLLAANYFEERKPRLIAERTGIVPVVVPIQVGGEEGIDTYFELVDTWVERLRAAYEDFDSRSATGETSP